MAVANVFITNIHSALQCLNYKVFEIDVKLHAHRTHEPGKAHLYIAECPDQDGERWGKDRVVVFHADGSVEAVYEVVHYDLSGMVAVCHNQPMEHAFR